MLPQEEEAAAGAGPPQHPNNTNNDTPKRALRAHYPGALPFNIAAFTLPALAGTLPNP